MIMIFTLIIKVIENLKIEQSPSPVKMDIKLSNSHRIKNWYRPSLHRLHCLKIYSWYKVPNIGYSKITPKHRKHIIIF